VKKSTKSVSASLSGTCPSFSATEHTVSLLVLCFDPLIIFIAHERLSKVVAILYFRSY